MANNGLCIDEKEFLSLPQKKQMCVLFQNTEELKRLIKGYKLYYRVTTIIGSVLVVGIGILFKMHFIVGA